MAETEVVTRFKEPRASGCSRPSTAHDLTAFRPRSSILRADRVTRELPNQKGHAMRCRILFFLLAFAPPAPGAHGADIAAGLSEALVIGTERVVEQLGRPGGFLDDPTAHIPLPGPLEKAKGALRLAGMAGMVDELEVRMNRAAEEATPVAEDLIIQAIHGLSFEDAVGVLKGPDDSATRYLERQTTKPLGRQMRPIVDRALADVGAVQTFESIAGGFKSIPFAGALDVDLTGHVVTYAKKAIFTFLAQEEAAIRTNPAARTTSLLKSVFGG
jgi:Protein of unknown function (DUF4197)